MIDSIGMSSPSLRLCNLEDPEFVHRQCSPFSNQTIENNDFSMEFVESHLLPEIKSVIKQDKKTKFDTMPTLFRMIMDNFPEEGSEFLKNEIFPIIQSTIKFGGPRKASDLTHLALEIASVIPRYYRDDIVIDLISRYYLDDDQSTRGLAVHLIPIVSDFWRILPFLETLSKDKSSAIRGAVVLILPNCVCDEDSIKSIMSQAVKDPFIGVRQVAASVMGNVCPSLLKEFKELLEDPKIIRYAFPSLPEIIAQNSFSQIIDSFFEAIKLDKNDAAVAMLETVKKANIKSEEPLYIRAASELILFTPFAWRLHDFASTFSNKNDFLDLLDPAKIHDWRTRFALLKQCEEFVPELGSRLVRLAEIYSEDQTAVIRNESVNLWVRLIKEDASIQSEMIERLMRGSWQKRMILCKVIKQLGLSRFDKVVEMLKNDAISNVRDCINEI